MTCDANLPTIVFVHLPKCSGTSARAYFHTVFGEKHVGWIDLTLSREQLLEENTYRDNNWRVVGGHFSLQDAIAIPLSEKLYVTIVREPVSRVISLFYFISRTRTHPLHTAANRLGFEGLITESSAFRTQASNYQSRMLSGRSRTVANPSFFRSALQSLATNGVLLADVDHAPKLFEHLNARFGIVTTVDYGRYNVRPRDASDGLTSNPRIRQLILSMNKDDAKLSELVRKRCEKHDEFSLSSSMPPQIHARTILNRFLPHRGRRENN